MVMSTARELLEQRRHTLLCRYLKEVDPIVKLIWDITTFHQGPLVFDVVSKAFRPPEYPEERTKQLQELEELLDFKYKNYEKELREITERLKNETNTSK